MPKELRIEVGHSPSNPTTDQKVRVFAEATGNVSKIEILINGRLATTCAGRRCNCLVGPFPAGTVTYYANAYGETRMVTSGDRQFTVGAARPARPSRPVISGRVTGETDLVQGVSATNVEQPSQRFTASIAANGEFEFFDLPDGRYYVSPTSAIRKVKVNSEPRYHEVRCQGRRSHIVNFEIKGIDPT